MEISCQGILITDLLIPSYSSPSTKWLPFLKAPLHCFHEVPNPNAAEYQLKAEGHLDAILIGPYNECVLLFIKVEMFGDDIVEKCSCRDLLVLNYDDRIVVCHNSVADASAMIKPVIIHKLKHLETDSFTLIWRRNGCRELRWCADTLKTRRSQIWYAIQLSIGVGDVDVYCW